MNNRSQVKHRPLGRLPALALLGLVAAALLVPRGITEAFAYSRRYALADVPAAPVAIVFGGGLTPDGQPSPALEDRLNAAVHLYISGKVASLLLSGERRSPAYDEPAAMQRYALRLGLPASALVLDGAGYTTYDTCVRAAERFNIRQAILVTTDFHLPRSLYLCSGVGITSVGVATGWGSSPRGPNYLFGVLREFPATAKALWYLTAHHRPGDAP